MTDPYDVERAIHEIRHNRGRGDALIAESGRMADKVADGFRCDFDSTMDMETVGKALVVAAASLIALTDPPASSAAVVLDVLAFAGENIVRTARARAAETADLEEQLAAAFAADTLPLSTLTPVDRTPVEGVLCEHVLTWHQLNGAPPVTIPFGEHWVFPTEACGEFRLSAREVSGG